MIEISALTKTYHSKNTSIKALNQIDLNIGEGMFGLLGPNGAGKTTLMRILAGIIPPTKGCFRVDGREIRSDEDRKWLKNMLGYLPQELGLYPDLNARQFVDYMAVLKGVEDPNLRQKRVAEVLDMVGLSDNIERPLKGFSGGMKRRVGIAQALVNDPHILIVDEPTAGLDPEERIRFRNLLVNLASNRVVLLSTHIVEDIGQTCRDMAVLSHGSVLFQGSPNQLIESAKDHVWMVTSNSTQQPNNGLTVVSMLHLTDGIQYRLVGSEPVEYPNAAVVQPGLEDGYVWLMKSNAQKEADRVSSSPTLGQTSNRFKQWLSHIGMGR